MNLNDETNEAMSNDEDDHELAEINPMDSFDQGAEIRKWQRSSSAPDENSS